MVGYWEKRQASFDEAWPQKKKELKELGISYLLASFVDIHGVPKAKAVPLENFEAMMKGSELFTLAAVDGLDQRVQDDEASVRPDLDAITPMPWMEGVAWAPGSLYFHGEPWPSCPRNVLKRQIQRAAAKGFVFRYGIEPETYLIRIENGHPVLANPQDKLAKAAYDIPSLLDAPMYPYIKEMVEYMEKLGWRPTVYGHEDANSQLEIDWEPADCMTTSDRATLFRMMAKHVAAKYGAIATFIPKPFANRTGTGWHFNTSLVDKETGKNMFDDPKHPYNLSQLGSWFTGGLLKHGEALSAILAPTVNSYKRLIKGGSITGYTWCPVYITYGRNNRTNMVRVSTMEGPWQKFGQRVEIRTVDGSVNPYLGSAATLAAGLEGIEKQIAPGTDYDDINLYDLSDEDLRKRNIRVLPRTLLEAVEAFEKDQLMKEVFGPRLHEIFCEVKYAEWWDYHRTISEWEIERYINTYHF